MPTPLLDNRQLGPDTARLNLLTTGVASGLTGGNATYLTNANGNAWFAFESNP